MCPEFYIQLQKPEKFDWSEQINSGKPIAEIARDLGISDGTLGNWMTAAKKRGLVDLVGREFVPDGPNQ